MATTPGDRRTSGRATGRAAAGRPRRTGPVARRPEARRPERKLVERRRVAAAAEERAQERHRSRLTGRAAILVLVLAVLAVSYASSLRAYLQQRSHIESLESVIAEREASIEDLKRERERRRDPGFVAQEARRYGYVLPGETPFVVIDEDGEPLTDAELDDPASVGQQEPPAWYDGVWSSVELAGDPPTKIPPQPDKRIVGSEDG